MKIALGSDHAGYTLKRQIMEHLQKQGIECEDFGAPNAVDAASYVPAAVAVSHAVLDRRADYGIVICGTGLGISITANKQRVSAPRSAPTNSWRAWPVSIITPMSSAWGPASSARLWLLP